MTKVEVADLIIRCAFALTCGALGLMVGAAIIFSNVAEKLK